MQCRQFYIWSRWSVDSWRVAATQKPVIYGSGGSGWSQCRCQQMETRYQISTHHGSCSSQVRYLSLCLCYVSGYLHILVAVALHSRVHFTKALYTYIRYLHLRSQTSRYLHILCLGSRNSALSYVRYLQLMLDIQISKLHGGCSFALLCQISTVYILHIMFITLAEALPLLLCSFKLYLYFADAVSSSSSASRHLVRCQVLEPRELRGGVQLAAHQETSAVRRGQGPAKIFIHSLEKYHNLYYSVTILYFISYDLLPI